MKSADELITAIRYRTGQSKYTYDIATGTTTAGMANSIFIEVLNDAQDSIGSRILKLYPSLFQAEKTFSVVASTESYSMAGQLAFGTKLISVQYSPSGNTTDYRPLDRLSVYDRRGYVGYPSGYFLKAGSINLSPIPSSSVGTLRVLYYRKIDRLDYSRGTVSGTPSGTTATILSPDSFPLAAANYVCISDRFGNIMLRNGVVSSFAVATLTLAANVSTYLETGYALSDLAGGYVTIGANTTRYSSLADECERYLRLYGQKRIMTINENSAAAEEDQEVRDTRDDILSSYAEEARDTEPFPITDPEAYF